MSVLLLCVSGVFTVQFTQERGPFINANGAVAFGAVGMSVLIDFGYVEHDVADGPKLSIFGDF